MDKSEQITLEAPKYKSDGISQLVKDGVTTRKIFCKIQNVKRSEWAAAANNGKRAAYWHVADVFMKIDEQAFDPNYLLFCGLMVAAFIIGEVAIYLRKPGQPKKA